MRNRFVLFIGVSALILGLNVQVRATGIDEKINEMITAYSQSTKGLNDPVFQKKVNELDNELREKLEKDLDITPFQKLLGSALKFKSRKSARSMFEVALTRAQKRLTFTKAQQEIKDPELIKKMDSMTVSIERYLDPSLPDDDSVDAKKLQVKRKAKFDKFQKERARLA